MLTVDAVQCRPLPVQRNFWAGFGVSGVLVAVAGASGGTRQPVAAADSGVAGSPRWKIKPGTVSWARQEPHRGLVGVKDGALLVSLGRRVRLVRRRVRHAVRVRRPAGGCVPVVRAGGAAQVHPAVTR